MSAHNTGSGIDKPLSPVPDSGKGGSGLVSSCLSTGDVTADEGFELWRASCSPLFDTRIRDRHERDGFFAETRAYMLGDTVLMDARSIGQAFDRSHALCLKEEVDCFLVQLFLSAGYVGEHAGRPIHVRPGDIGVLDMARVLRTETAGTRFRCLNLFIPRAELLALVTNPNVLAGAVVRGESAMGRLLRGHLMSVWEVLPHARSNDIASLRTSTLGVLGAALNAEGEVTPHLERARNQAQLVQLKDFIEANLSNPELGASTLCRAFRCSRSHLYRLFHPLGGISHYVTQRRLVRAYREFTRLSHAGTRVSEVAFALGFNSQSHFARLFREKYGVTPTDAIELGRSDAGPYTGNEQAGRQLPDWHHWIRHL